MYVVHSICFVVSFYLPMLVWRSHILCIEEEWSSILSTEHFAVLQDFCGPIRLLESEFNASLLLDVGNKMAPHN